MFSNGRCLSHRSNHLHSVENVFLHFHLHVGADFSPLLFKKNLQMFPLKESSSYSSQCEIQDCFRRGLLLWAFLSETGSESFEKFLSLLGDSITLQGWAGYRGGLDTKSKRPHTCTSSPPLLFLLTPCLFDLQTTQQGSSQFTPCIRATSSCSTCPPCCPTPKRTNSR